MYKVTIRPHWEITQGREAPLDMATLLALLMSVQDTGSISQAARSVGWSYRYAWGLLREVEKLFAVALIQTDRGRGTKLTPMAEKLIWADRRIAARLSPLLESLASELEVELGKILTGQARLVRLEASHGFAVAAMMTHLNSANISIDLRYRNSTDAVAALSRRECDLAGFHVPIGEFEKPAIARYMQWLNPKEHCLIHLAIRNQGLFVAPGNPHAIVGVADLVRNDVRFVNRQAGSGTRMMLELMLAAAGIDKEKINGYESAEFTHSAIAAYIASDMADVGIGVQTAAHRFGLDFIPVVRERYFLAVSIAALEDPQVQQVIDVLQSDAFRDAVDGLAGYDASDMGTLISLPEAFGLTDVDKTD